MNLGRVTQAACLNTSPPPDDRCADDAFRLSHPDLCPSEPSLVIKPAFALACQLGSVQFAATYTVNGIETDVTASTVFQSSNPNVAVVGAASGNATGLTPGEVTITAAYNGRTAFGELTVLGDDCCDERTVAMMVVVDHTRSMSQVFGAGYPTKLAFAKAAATRFISEVNQSKDTVGLIQFTALSNEVLSSPVADKDAVEALVPGIAQTQQLTTLYDALTESIAQLAAVTADTKVILLISDGEDTDDSYSDSDNPLTLMSDFKSQGGVVITLGVRAHDFGYNLLSALATGGFFLNAYSAVAALSLEYLSGLKGYICAGNCTPEGDTFEASGTLNYCGFANWNVVDGHVDLLGNGFLDLLPGNGLYVDLAGSRSEYKGRMESRNTYGIESGSSYRLKLRLAGNQRVNASPNSARAKVYARNTDEIPNPTNPPVVGAAGGSGTSALETYEYAYSYVNANGETELSPVATGNNGSFGSFSVVVTADASTSATLVRFYKREQGTTTWHRIAESDPETPVIPDSLNNVTLSAAVAAGTIDACNQPVDENTTGTPIVLLDQTISINAFQQGFSDFNLTFVAPYTADVWISIQQIDTPSGYDATGLLLDRVTFESTDGDTLLDDAFDTENVVYVPPRCGLSTVQSYGYGSDGVPLIPAMISNTAPSGVVSSGTLLTDEVDWYLAFDQAIGTTWLGTHAGGVVPDTEWLQYQFATIQTVGAYALTSHIVDSQTSPSSWIFEGSNNGSDWTTLDEREDVTGWVDDVARLFTLSSPASFAYFRITFRETVGTVDTTFSVSEIQFYGSVFSLSYTAAYNCYGEGCLDEPPSIQTEDPSPLTDIEGGFNPPAVFTSTKQVCVSCPAGSINLGTENLIPAMTSNTTPYGVASASSSFTTFLPWKAFDRANAPWASSAALPQWVRYQLPSAMTAAVYAMTAYKTFAPTAWILQGSADGTTWTDLDSRSGQVWGFNQRKMFEITTPAAYLYYRLYITAAVSPPSDTGGVVALAELELFAAAPTSVCATRTAEGATQQQADNAATTAATEAATAQLNCVARYTSTQIATAHCESCGPDVTRSATRTSLNSQSEADALALTDAQEDADADLDCEQSINDQPVQFNNGTLAIATPYPSYHFVEGETGTISGLTITLKNLRHFYPDGMVLVLEAPDGTAVMLINDDTLGYFGPSTPGGGGVDIVIDDSAATSLAGIPGPVPAGSYKPTVEASGETLQLPTPAPTQPYGILMSEFDGISPNGCWKLWCIHDQFYTVFNPADAKIIGGWTLDFGN